MTAAVSLALSVLAAEPASATAEVFADKGDLFVRAGKSRGLEVGSEVTLLDEQRKEIGKAAVMEVWDNLARIVPDERAKKAGAKHAALPGGPAPQKSAGCADPPGEVEEMSWAFSVRDDVYAGACCGVRAEVRAHGTMMGAALKLVVDGATADQQEPFSGNTVTLKGTSKGRAIAVTVKVGAFGGDYSLKIGGKPCQLVKQ